MLQKYGTGVTRFSITTVTVSVEGWSASWSGHFRLVTPIAQDAAGCKVEVKVNGV